MTSVYSPLHGFIWNQHSDSLPVGLLAQLVEHCTGIAEVMGSNPVQAWTSFRPSFHHYLSSVHHCEDRFHIHVFNRSSNVWLLYIQNRVSISSIAYFTAFWRWNLPAWRKRHLLNIYRSMASVWSNFLTLVLQLTISFHLSFTTQVNTTGTSSNVSRKVWITAYKGDTY